VPQQAIYSEKSSALVSSLQSQRNAITMALTLFRQEISCQLASCRIWS
jgi:hypothetical protein